MSFAASGDLSHRSLCFRDFSLAKAPLDFDTFVADILLCRAICPKVGPFSLKTLFCLSILGVTKRL